MVLARLTAEGAIDPAFHADLTFPVNFFAAAPTNKVLVSTEPQYGAGLLSRLNPDGSQDRRSAPHHLKDNCWKVFPLLYTQLLRLATHKLANERPGQTLQPTALVHEVCLRLADAGPTRKWYDRAAFMGAAAEAMRRILVDSARRKRRLKHGGDLQRVDLEAVELVLSCPDEQLLALDEALTHARRRW